MKRMTKMDKVERIHKLNEKIESAEESAAPFFELAKKSKKPFRISVAKWGNSNSTAWGIQPRDFSEETHIRLQKYYTRLVKEEIKSMKDERTRLLRLLK